MAPAQDNAAANSDAARPRPVALVTGSTRGIGEAIAGALQARGWRVVGHGRTARDPDTVAADLDDPAAPAVLWQEALERAGGRIDALINNAGLFEATALDSSDIVWLDDWDRILRINLSSAAQLSRFAVRQWLAEERGEQAAGRLVNIASRAANRGDSPAHWHYAAAKGGMVAMTKTIARAYAARGVLAFAVCPGFTDTSTGDDYLASRGGATLLKDIPLGRVALPEEIAAIAAFCAIDAPPSMTGAVLDANGASHVR